MDNKSSDSSASDSKLLKELSKTEKKMKLSDKNFTQVPNRVFKDTDLSISSRLLYVTLLSYAFGKNFCFPKLETLADTMGISERQISNLIKELKKKGYLKTEKMGYAGPNRYQLKYTASKSHFTDSSIDLDSEDNKTAA